MKKIFVGLAGIIMCCIAVEGNAGDIKTDYNKKADFSSLKKYAWMESKKAVGINNPADLDRLVKDAVNAQLSQKGFSIVEGGTPDFWVVYYAVVEDKTEEFILDNRYEGYSDAFYDRLAPYAGPAGQKRTEIYKEGTLIIDIVDANTKKLVWRSTAQKRVNKNLKREEKEKRVKEGISKMLLQFPPRQSKGK